MRILVTGGAGYIGSHTVRHLLDLGHHVAILDNLSTGHREFVPDSVKLYVASIENTLELTSILYEEEIEAVIHFAAKSLVGEDIELPAAYYGTNVVGTISLLNAMVQANVKRLVFSSSCAVYGMVDSGEISEDFPRNPISVYGESKLAMENIIRAYSDKYGITYAALRYFNAAGASLDNSVGEWHYPETHLIPRAIISTISNDSEKFEFTIFGKDFPTPDGTPIRDYIHVQDLARAHALALHIEKSNEINLGSGNGHSVLEVLSAVEELTENKIPRVFGPRRKGDPARLIASNKKASEVLKWQTEITLNDIVKSAVRWHRSGLYGRV